MTFYIILLVYNSSTDIILYLCSRWKSGGMNNVLRTHALVAYNNEPTSQQSKFFVLTLGLTNDDCSIIALHRKYMSIRLFMLV